MQQTGFGTYRDKLLRRDEQCAQQHSQSNCENQHCHLAQANRRDRFRTIDQASRIIDDQVRQYLQKEITQIISPLFDSALDESMAMAQEGLANLFSGKLSHLSQKDRDLIEYWSKKVLARACYLPARQLAANIANSDVAPDLRLSYFAKNAR